jgi:limonene-1,2-epoxide hydrolase
VPTALERLLDAMNRHDLDAFVACFDRTYHSEQPVHPERTFSGSDQVRTNWGAIFAGVADFHAELLRSAQRDDSWWAEWVWRGTRADGSTLDVRGVTIFGIRDERITWGRLYLEDVDTSGAGIDSAVRQIAEGGG